MNGKTTRIWIFKRNHKITYFQRLACACKHTQFECKFDTAYFQCHFGQYSIEFSTTFVVCLNGARIMNFKNHIYRDWRITILTACWHQIFLLSNLCTDTKKNDTDSIFIHFCLTSMEVKFIVYVPLHFVSRIFSGIFHVMFIDLYGFVMMNFCHEFNVSTLFRVHMQKIFTKNQETKLKENHAMALIDKICTIFYGNMS